MLNYLDLDSEKMNIKFKLIPLYPNTLRDTNLGCNGIGGPVSAVSS